MACDHRPIRVTPTNAGPDSKGIVSVFGWDLEGLVAFYLVGGGVVGLILVLALTGSPIFTRLVSGLVPVGLAALWIRLFVHGRPPAYQSDVIERWLRGSIFRMSPQAWCQKKHPHRVLTIKRAEREAAHA